MFKRYLPVLVVFSLLGALVLGSCDSFFSKSWGSSREYDSSSISVTSGNLDAWVGQARKDPKLAEAVLKKIKEKVEGSTGAEKALFQDAGVSMAVESAGIGNTIMSHLSDALDLIDNTGGDQKQAIADLFDTIKGEISGNCDKAALNITEIIEPAGDPPQFSQEFKDKAKENPSTVIQAMMVLTLAELSDGTITMEDIQNNGVAELGGLTINDGYIEVDSTETAGAKVLAAYINMIVDGGFESNPILDGIKDMMLNS